MEIVAVSALRDNYIWTLCRGGQCIVVDPGDAAPVEDFLRETSRTLAAILLTHHHRDHVGGVSSLRSAWHVPVFGPDSALMPDVDHIVADGQTLQVPGIEQKLQVLAVPGHTMEHIAWYAPGIVCCGDTLFGAGCGRLLGGTASQLHASLQRLAALPAATQVCCAHEYTLANLRFARVVEPDNPATRERQERCEALRRAGLATLPSTLEEELATNPFLRVRQPTVHEAAEHAAGRPLRSDEEVFTALRAWKDHF